MVQVILKWIRISYKNTVNSIAFLPAIIAIGFLLLSFAAIEFDFSETGKNIKSNLHWLSLKDASTARSIASAVAGGIISLTVFSFTMVMILLNQAASQMSNRILDKLINNRFQQTVLGFYIGTIVYALFLLSTIRDIESGIYVPAISAYLLIALTIVDIFLFIYFLHYITQSVKYDTIIHRISDNTQTALNTSCILNYLPPVIPVDGQERIIKAYKGGIYQGFEREGLLELCKKEDGILTFLHPVGTFVLENTPLIKWNSNNLPADNLEKRLSLLVNIHRGQEINTSYYFGIKQLMEVAIKALSPGINDPGTAVISLHAIANLLAYRMHHFPQTNFNDDDGDLRIITSEKSFEMIFEEAVLPIWDYGKKDRSVQQEMQNVLRQLLIYEDKPVINRLYQKVNQAINEIQMALK